MPYNFIELTKFVTTVKTALEQPSVKETYIGFYDFPKGSCMDASILLGHLLSKNGFGDYNLMSAEHKDSQLTHAWLENDQYSIDITASQFEWGLELPLITPIGQRAHNSKGLNIKSVQSLKNLPVVPDIGYYTALTLVEKIIANSRK